MVLVVIEIEEPTVRLNEMYCKTVRRIRRVK
jgi:hypothetical protein